MNALVPCQDCLLFLILRIILLPNLQIISFTGPTLQSGGQEFILPPGLAPLSYSLHYYRLFQEVENRKVQ